ncbi:MAG: hypothetical protein K6G58_04260 [Lachnospiraceae bacterium]|nr:hypothetical protein [Lachnospiraceae bacterium]
MKKIRKFVTKAVAGLIVLSALTASVPHDAHAEIFYLQTGRRFDSDFYANYYPDLKAKYGYNAHKLLDHYINYGIFERRIPSMYYLYNMDALGVGDITPKELLYARKSLRKNCSEADFFNAYDEAYPIVLSARAAAPNNMYGQMQYVANVLYNRINFNPGVPYKTSGAHYNDPCGVFGTVDKYANGMRIPYGADCAGTTRAMGLCLNMLQIPYQHVNENQWKQQWCRVTINGKSYAIDPYLTPYVMEETTYVRLYPPFMP